MASTKEYRLLCLENPLLGKWKNRAIAFPIEWWAGNVHSFLTLLSWTCVNVGLRTSG
jgi:hypothetical protein